VELKGGPDLSLSTMQASGEMPMPAHMVLAGWWGDKFNRLYLNAVNSPAVKRVNVTVDLLPERRVASIENAWLATPEARPGDDVALKVFLRPYRGESIERDFTLKIPAGLAKGEHKIMLSDADTRLITSTARGMLRDLNPEIPARFQTFQQVYAAAMGSRKFNLTLIGFFGMAALLLATAGVFGVMAYSVSRRTREFGLRIALGATTGDVLRMVLGQGMRTILMGVAIGIAGSFALTQAISSLLFGVTATDPVTFAGVTLLLMVVALLACYLPARRATKVDPMVALRYE